MDLERGVVARQLRAPAPSGGAVATVAASSLRIPAGKARGHTLRLGAHRGALGPGSKVLGMHQPGARRPPRGVLADAGGPAGGRCVAMPGRGLGSSGEERAPRQSKAAAPGRGLGVRLALPEGLCPQSRGARLRKQEALPQGGLHRSAARRPFPRRQSGLLLVRGAVARSVPWRSTGSRGLPPRRPHQRPTLRLPEACPEVRGHRLKRVSFVPPTRGQGCSDPCPVRLGAGVLREARALPAARRCELGGACTGREARLLGQDSGAALPAGLGCRLGLEAACGGRPVRRVRIRAPVTELHAAAGDLLAANSLLPVRRPGDLQVLRHRPLQAVLAVEPLALDGADVGSGAALRERSEPDVVRGVLGTDDAHLRPERGAKQLVARVPTARAG
mmetsp:Transcript_4219/g.10211  ORF Transcript_4219/g.10211 Transcript_4219/m.10211 type:complete len:389 (-) Transcript_4219:1305-2471(-)